MTRPWSSLPPPGTQLEVARRAMRQGIAVVTTSNQTSEVRRLLELDDRSRRVPSWAPDSYLSRLSSPGMVLVGR